MRVSLSKHTRLCISLSGRPSNIGTRFHKYLYDLLDRLRGVTRLSQGVIFVCSSITPVASMSAVIWSSRPSALSCNTKSPSWPGITAVF